MALTAAGVVFLVEARQILTQVDRAARAARNTGSAAAPLRVGIVDSSYPWSVLWRAADDADRVRTVVSCAQAMSERLGWLTPARQLAQSGS